MIILDLMVRVAVYAIGLYIAPRAIKGWLQLIKEAE